MDAPAEMAEPLLELEPLPGVAIGPRLRLVRGEHEAVVLLGATPIHVWAREDRSAETAAMALLARARLARRGEIAVAFGRHRNTVARLAGRLEREGLAAVVPAKRGPKGPSKVTPQIRELVARHGGRPSGALRELIQKRTGVLLSAAYLRELRSAARSGQPRLLPESAPAPLPAKLAAAEPAGEPEAIVPACSRGRYLGAALYYPALEALGLLGAAAECFRLPRSERFGVRAITLTLFYLSLLGKSTPEAAKHLRRWEFGPLIGAGRAPAVKTLRRKLAELAGQDRAGHFGELLSRRWVEAGLLATAFLYVDGHMKVYSGKRRLSEVWNAQRRMPLPGVLHYFVGDQQGRPLLFVTEEANAALAKAMPRIVAAIRAVLGERAFTVIFDRGGYDGKLFRWLAEQKIDFVTYQRGSPDLAAERFGRRECRFEGQRVRMQIAEDTVKVGGSGPWRRIVVRTKEGHQTPILTSLTEDLAPARIACLMFARWRQENFFRYMRERYGLDQLLGNAYGPADGGRLVANPERKKIERDLKDRRAALAALRAELGQAVLDEPRSGGRSAHGLKVAQQGAVGKLRRLEKTIAELLERRRALPPKVPLAEAGPREVMRLEHKAIIDRVKISAYNAEEWLLDRLAHHYRNPHDIRALLRSFAELSGELRRQGDRLVVTLDPPDAPLQRRALRGLCEELDQAGATFPGTALPVSYDVAMHHSELAA